MVLVIIWMCLKMVNQNFTQKTKEEILEKQGGYCDCCGSPLHPYHRDGRPCHIHHRNPKHKDGSNSIRNGVALCTLCHTAIHRYVDKYPNNGYIVHKKHYKNTVAFKRHG